MTAVQEMTLVQSNGWTNSVAMELEGQIAMLIYLLTTPMKTASEWVYNNLYVYIYIIYIQTRLVFFLRYVKII